VFSFFFVSIAEGTSGGVPSARSGIWKEGKTKREDKKRDKEKRKKKGKNE